MKPFFSLIRFRPNLGWFVVTALIFVQSNTWEHFMLAMGIWVAVHLVVYLGICSYLWYKRFTGNHEESI